MNAKEKVIPAFGVKDQVGYVFGDMAGSFVNLFVDDFRRFKNCDERKK